MIRPFPIAVFSILVFLLGGCGGPAEPEDAVWKELKLDDLASSPAGGQAFQPLRTMNFRVYSFEVAADRVGAVQDISRMLYPQALRYNDEEGFKMNSFLGGFGQGPMWNEVVGILTGAGARKLPSVTLLVDDGQMEDVTVAGLNRRQTVFYSTAEGSAHGKEVGPGRIVMRLRPRRIASLRSVCNLYVEPVFVPPVSSPIPQLAARAKAEEYSFSSVGFAVRMGPGDFVLVGPAEYKEDRLSLSGLLFSNPDGSVFMTMSEEGTYLGKLERKPAVRAFLIVCMRL